MSRATYEDVKRFVEELHAAAATPAAQRVAHCIEDYLDLRRTRRRDAYAIAEGALTALIAEAHATRRALRTALMP